MSTWNFWNVFTKILWYFLMPPYPAPFPAKCFADGLPLTGSESWAIPEDRIVWTVFQEYYHFFFPFLKHSEFMNYDPLYPRNLSVNPGGWKNACWSPNSEPQAHCLVPDVRSSRHPIRRLDPAHSLHPHPLPRPCHRQCWGTDFLAHFNLSS